MVPIARIVHATDQRIRVKVPSMRGNRRYFSAVAHTLETLDGIACVRVNAAAASIIVDHVGLEDGLPRTGLDHGLFFIPADHEPGRGTALIHTVTPDRSSSGVATKIATNKIYRAVREGHNRSAIENIAHGIVAYRTRGDAFLAGLLMIGGILQIARGDVLSSILAVVFGAIDSAQRPLPAR